MIPWFIKILLLGFIEDSENYLLIVAYNGHVIYLAGYGDMIPLSTLGKCMGSFAVFCGLIIIALPATIIVTRFSEEYERSKMQNEMNPCSSVAMWKDVIFW